MIDVTDMTFNEEVVAASHRQPVVVDLWAPWCGPCKSLAPILEKVIDETDGEVLGAKVNIDENPEVARAMQAQSIPLVIAFRDGQPVDGFLGAQGEPMVRDFVAKLLSDPAALVAGAADDDPIAPVTDVETIAATTEPPASVPDFDLTAVEIELENLLATVKTDDSKRQRFIELLELLGPDHPVTAPWRKRLSTVLH